MVCVSQLVGQCIRKTKFLNKLVIWLPLIQTYTKITSYCRPVYISHKTSEQEVKFEDAGKASSSLEYGISGKKISSL